MSYSRKLEEDITAVRKEQLKDNGHLPVHSDAAKQIYNPPMGSSTARELATINCQKAGSTCDNGDHQVVKRAKSQRLSEMQLDVDLLFERSRISARCTSPVIGEALSNLEGAHFDQVDTSRSCVE